VLLADVADDVMPARPWREATASLFEDAAHDPAGSVAFENELLRRRCVSSDHPADVFQDTVAETQDEVTGCTLAEPAGGLGYRRRGAASDRARGQARPERADEFRLARWCL
jgi:hypothetical protein